MLILIWKKILKLKKLKHIIRHELRGRSDSSLRAGGSIGQGLEAKSLFPVKNHAP